MKKKSKWRRKLIVAVVVLFIAVSIGISLRNKDTGIAVTTAAVRTTDITSTVTGTGRIYAEVEVRISSEVSGEIIDLPVSDGSRVQRGDLLVKVNPDTLEAQVLQQEAGLSAARASSAQNMAEKLKAGLDLRRTNELHQKGFATQDQLDQAHTMLLVREASFQASQHQIERQEMQLKEARDLLGKATIYAPIDGTVVRVNSEVGDRVVGTGQFEGTLILRVANLDSMEVRIDVSEADIVHVEVGQSASVEVDAIPNEKFSGQVTEIAHSAETSDQRSQEQLTTFSVKVKLDDPNPRIRPGMTATAEIETATVMDALTVPLLSVVVRPAREINEALGESEKRQERGNNERAEANGSDARNRGHTSSRPEQTRIVFVVKDNVAHMRKVETGIADRNRIEIKSGLAQGETVITGSYRALTRELSHLSEISIDTDGSKNPWER